MKSKTRILVNALLAACCAATAHAQSSGSDHGTYLRIANLLPITAKKVDLYRGAEPFMTGMKPGFFMSYAAVGQMGTNRFVLKQGDAILGEFTLPSGGKGGFYTAAIYQDAGSGPTMAFLDDAPKKDPDQPEDPTKPPKKRLRLYVGGYDFPIKISAPPLGEWEVHNKTLILDVDVPGPTPEGVSLEFVDKYGEKIRLFFPTDYSQYPCYSTFVSQRGIQRPRISSDPDNVKPDEDTSEDASAASGQPQPTPTP